MVLTTPPVRGGPLVNVAARAGEKAPPDYGDSSQRAGRAVIVRQRSLQVAVVDIHTRPICCPLHGNPHSRVRIGKAWPVMTVSRPHQILVIDRRTLHVDYHPTATRRSRADCIESDRCARTALSGRLSALDSSHRV